MKIKSQDILAFAVSLALHVLVAALLWFGAPELFRDESPKVVPIQAVFLDGERQQKRALEELKREQAQRQQKLEAERQRQAELKRKAQQEAREKAEAAAKRKAQQEAEQKAAAQAKREAEEAARQKAAAEAKRKAEEEARRKAKAEAQRKAKEEAQRKKAAEEAARKKAEAERKRKQEERERKFREALQAEEAAIKADQEAAAQAKRDVNDRDRYIARLSQHIQRNWSRPAGVEEDFACKIHIRQLPGGQIQSYDLLESCGNSFLDASVESAIRKSDPLPLPENQRVFEKDLTLTFTP